MAIIENNLPQTTDIEAVRTLTPGGVSSQSDLNALSDALPVHQATLEVANSYTNGKVSKEATARQEADETLQNNIDSEEQARQSADSTLQENIDSEAEAREAADTALQQAITAEETAREQADTALQAAIDQAKADGVYTAGTDAIQVSAGRVISLKVNPQCKMLVNDTNGLLCDFTVDYDGTTGTLSFVGKNDEVITSVDFPVEQILNSAEVVTDAPEGTPGTGPWLKLVFNVTDSSGSQSTQTTYVDLADVLSAISSGNGIDVQSGTISIKLVPGETFLSAGANGLGVSGTLDVAHGGTGATSLDDVTVGNASKVPFEGIQDKPTTLSGYGITDAMTASAINTALAKYLPLAGGRMSGEVKIDRGIGNVSGFSCDTRGAYISLEDGSAVTIFYICHDGIFYQPNSGVLREVWHAGNFNPDDTFMRRGDWITSEDAKYLTKPGCYMNTDNQGWAGILMHFQGAGSLSAIQIKTPGGGSRDTQIRFQTDGSPTGWSDWYTLYTSANLGEATSSAAGLMSAADKVKLDSLASAMSLSVIDTPATLEIAATSENEDNSSEEIIDPNVTVRALRSAQYEMTTDELLYDALEQFARNHPEYTEFSAWLAAKEQIRQAIPKTETTTEP